MGHGHAHRKESSCRGLKSPKPKPLSCYVPLALVVCFQVIRLSQSYLGRNIRCLQATAFPRVAPVYTK